MENKAKIGDYRILEYSSGFYIQLYDYHNEYKIGKWWQRPKTIKVLKWASPNMYGKVIELPLSHQLTAFDIGIMPFKTLSEAKGKILSWIEKPIIHEMPL